MPTVTWSDGIPQDAILWLVFSLKRQQGLTLALAPIPGPVFGRAVRLARFLASLDAAGVVLSFDDASVKLPA